MYSLLCPQRRYPAIPKHRGFWASMTPLWCRKRPLQWRSHPPHPPPHSQSQEVTSTFHMWISMSPCKVTVPCAGHQSLYEAHTATLLTPLTKQVLQYGLVLVPEAVEGIPSRAPIRQGVPSNPATAGKLVKVITGAHTAVQGLQDLPSYADAGLRETGAGRRLCGRVGDYQCV